MKTDSYIIVFDQTDPTLDRAAFKETLRLADWVHAWWNHLPSVFILRTDLNARKLRKIIKQQTGDASFLVLAADITRLLAFCGNAPGTGCSDRLKPSVPNHIKT